MTVIDLDEEPTNLALPTLYVHFSIEGSTAVR